MLAEDVGTVNISVEALGLSRVARETLHGVRDVQTAIDSTLHGTEDTGTGGGTSQTNIQITTEGTWSIIDRLHVELLTSDLGATGVKGVQAQLVQQTTGNKQTSAVSCSVVGQTNLLIIMFIRLINNFISYIFICTYLDAIVGQLVRVGRADNTVTLDTSVSDLGGDVLVGQTHNQTVLGGVVLVLVLESQTLPGIVIGFALTTPAEFNLVALEVLLVLDYLDETL